MSSNSYDSLAGYCKSIAGSGQPEADSCTCYYTMEYAQDLLTSFNEKTNANQAKYDDALSRWNTAYQNQEKALTDFWSNCRIKEACTDPAKCCKKSSTGDWYGKCNKEKYAVCNEFNGATRHTCGMPDDNVKKYVAKNLDAWEKYYKAPQAPTEQQQPVLNIACCSDSITGDANDYTNILQTCSATICTDDGCTDTDDGGDVNTIYCTKDTTCKGFANRCSNDNICVKDKNLLLWLILLSLGILISFILMICYTAKWRGAYRDNAKRAADKTKLKSNSVGGAPKPIVKTPPPPPRASPKPVK